MTCKAIVKRGKSSGNQCSNKKKFGDFCGVHKYYESPKPIIIKYENYYEEIYTNSKGQKHRDNNKPAVILFNYDGKVIGERFYKNGLKHRDDDKPAVVELGIWGFGIFKQWWINGVLHRANGPAVEYTNGDKEWWVNGIEITNLRSSLKRLVLNKKLRLNARRAAQKWALKCAIEWRPPHGVKYVEMMSEIDGSL